MNLQVFLAYSGWQVQETGQYDAATRAAVTELQQAYNVKPPDGIVGVQTRYVLNCLLQGKDPFERPPVAPPGPAGGIAGRLKNMVAGTTLDVHNFSREKPPLKAEAAEEKPPPAPPPAPKYPASAVVQLGVEWLDEGDQPLYRRPRTQSGYQMNEMVLHQMLSHVMLTVLKRVAPRAVAFGAPDRGRFEGLPYTELLEKAEQKELDNFLVFVTRYPGKYVGKPLKFPNAYLAWIKGGAVLE